MPPSLFLSNLLGLRPTGSRTGVTREFVEPSLYTFDHVRHPDPLVDVS
jgi:hypothetical protein